MRMNIRQILRVSDQGVSRPYQCYDEDGVLRWCKGNHTGLKSLMSEWICARVGTALRLPVPPCDILRSAELDRLYRLAVGVY